jgi:hypothetical protein
MPAAISEAGGLLKFRDVVLMMQAKAHRTDDGFRRIVEIAFSMNKNGKQRRYTLEQVLAEPLETVRRASLETEAMRQSDPGGDIGRAAEMTAPSAGSQSVGGNSDA